MKHEWKKHEKGIYGAKTKPCVLDIPAQKYIILSGRGNPNDEIFSDKVAALFSVAYKIKMAYKAFAPKSNEITDYTVYPLEGIWSMDSEKEYLVKEELQYRIMIRQPDFISREMFDNALETVKVRKNILYLTDISFETICDGRCIQILHKGVFDDEPASFEIMDGYCMEHGYKRMGKEHREIYLNNANRTDKANLKTILRYKVTDTEK
ncbi:GyrI-like domain-containing protein [Lachnospiraceae bacterium JLR.KK009]